MSENDTDHPPTGTESSPADAFALVGHEIRVEILRVLDGESELSFGELRSRMSTDVEPSQLHYHLQQLVGHFVGKTDGSYRLRPVGRRLCLALHAGTFDRRHEHLRIDAGFDCYHCQASVEAIFYNGGCKIECPACEHIYGDAPYKLSPEAFEDEGVAFTHASKYLTIYALYVFSMARGFCWNCTHPLNVEFQSCEESPGPRKVRISRKCDRCGATGEVRVGQVLLADPGLRWFCYEHGVDILTTSFWELEFAVTDNQVTIHSADPWEVALQVTYDGETLELIVDGDLNVVERNLHGASAVSEVVLPDNDACLQSLRRNRWPDGVICPHCDNTDIVKIGTTTKDAQRYRCQTCGRTFNDLTDTIFASHRLSVPEMVHITREMAERNTTQIARQLDRSYPAVLAFVHEVQDTPAEEFELDLSSVFDAEELS